MAPLIDALFFIIGGLFTVVTWVLIISAVMSWLVAFNIINLSNRGMYQFYTSINSFTDVILAPFRAIIPPIGGLDLSFIVAYLAIKAIQVFLLYPAKMSLLSLIG